MSRLPAYTQVNGVFGRQRLVELWRSEIAMYLLSRLRTSCNVRLRIYRSMASYVGGALAKGSPCTRLRE